MKIYLSVEEAKIKFDQALRKINYLLKKLKDSESDHLRLFKKDPTGYSTTEWGYTLSHKRKKLESSYQIIENNLKLLDGPIEKQMVSLDVDELSMLEEISKAEP